MSEDKYKLSGNQKFWLIFWGIIFTSMTISTCIESINGTDTPFISCVMEDVK